MRIAMIGSGYVGLVSGACLADFGHVVTRVDRDASRIEALKRGQSPIFEPGLTEIVESNVRQNRLFFTTELASAVDKAAKRNVIHPNKAANLKSKTAKAIAGLDAVVTIDTSVAHLAAAMGNSGQIYAHDSDPRRLAERRAGAARHAAAARGRAAQRRLC